MFNFIYLYEDGTKCFRPNKEQFYKFGFLHPNLQNRRSSVRWLQSRSQSFPKQWIFLKRLKSGEYGVCFLRIVRSLPFSIVLIVVLSWVYSGESRTSRTPRTRSLQQTAAKGLLGWTCRESYVNPESLSIWQQSRPYRHSWCFCGLLGRLLQSRTILVFLNTFLENKPLKIKIFITADILALSTLWKQRNFTTL